MSAAGTGGGVGGPGSGTTNPRKFSEKIALHTQRQAEETAAFQEVMMDITSTRMQAQKVRLARTQGPYYGGSLPNVNQIGRSTPDFQGPFHSNLEPIRFTRHHGLVERVQREKRFISPGRPYRRQTDSSPYSSPYLSPPPDPSWRRNWSTNFGMDKSHLFRLPTTALNRTNSDSALHTSVMNPNGGDRLSSGHTLAPSGRRSGATDGDARKMFPCPVPPIEENILDDGKLKLWDSKKSSIMSSRPKSCEVPGINILLSLDQQSCSAHIPSALNTGGSLPDLSSLHFPSPLPTPLDPDESGYPPSGGNSTGNLANNLTHLGINAGNAFHLPGFSASLQGTLSNPSLQSSLSNPNIQSSLSSHSFPTSLSSTSLHSSLSNPSLQSSLSPSPSLQSSLSNQSLHSSLSNSSLQSSASNPSFGGSASCVSSYSPLMSGQQQQQLSTSPRRRAQLSPLILPMVGEARRHHSKQFSPTISPTLSSITQGVPLDTSRLPSYPYSQPQHQQKGVSAPQPAPSAPLSQTGQQRQQLPHLQHRPHTQLHPHSLQKAPTMQPMQRAASQGPPQSKDGSTQNCHNTHMQAFPEPQHQQQQQHHHQQQHHQQPGLPSLPALQQMSHSLAGDLNLYNKTSSLLNSLLDDPYLGLQLTSRQSQSFSQQFHMEPQVDSMSFNHSSGSGPLLPKEHEGSYPVDQVSLNFQNSGDQQLLNNQNQDFTGGGLHNVPNIILTGDSPTSLSKEITSALSSMPGFEVDPFALDDTLRMDPMSLEGLGILADGEIMLADPAVEDSFRSDRLK